MIDLQDRVVRSLDFWGMAFCTGIFAREKLNVYKYLTNGYSRYCSLPLPWV
jgi:hypothetical protein